MPWFSIFSGGGTDLSLSDRFVQLVLGGKDFSLGSVVKISLQVWLIVSLIIRGEGVCEVAGW